jgi:hypothetical protein
MTNIQITMIKRKHAKVIFTSATKQINFRHSGESLNPLEKLDAGSGPA